MSAFVLRAANVLDEAGAFSGPLDVAVANGAVAEVGRGLAVPDAVSIDFADLFLLSGVFGCHLHVALSSLEALEFGGVLT
jgi:cytosine/adenosine deaminase-related metal-dependent hydrolase